MTKHELCTAVGARLRARRLELALTLTDVAVGAELSVGFVSQIERAVNAPSLYNLYRVAKALDLSLVRLFTEIDGAK